MKITFSSRQLFVLGFLLLLATNILVLAGVLYNRSGEPDARITLTERELRPPYYTHDENSGIGLQITWRTQSNRMNERYLYNPRPLLFSSYGNLADWLDRDKLDALGLDTETVLKNGVDRKRRKASVPREAYLVLEYDGAAYRQALAQAQAAVTKEREALASKPGDKTLQERLEKAELWLSVEQTEASRLFAVDAGLNPGLLRQRYSDRSGYIIAKGLISAEYRSSDCDKPNVAGRIERINIDSILVPLQFRKLFDDMELPRTRYTDDTPKPPRYSVELVYGSRLEPWIEDVHRLPDSGSGDAIGEVQAPTSSK